LPFLDQGPTVAAGADAAAATVTTAHTTPSAASAVVSAHVAGRTVSIPRGRLRPIADPLVAALGLLRKTEWIVGLPPGRSRCPRRAAVGRFWRLCLFGPGAHGGTLKRHLAAVLSSSEDPCGVDRLSYRDIGRLVDELAREWGFAHSIVGGGG